MVVVECAATHFQQSRNVSRVRSQGYWMVAGMVATISAVGNVAEEAMILGQPSLSCVCIHE